MLDAHDFLKNLALVLCVAAATSLIFQRLRQPVVFGYLIAGMLVGPHIPVPLVADQNMVRTLSELGVILVMFSLGLEFRLRSLAKLGPTSGLVALVECGAMLWLGFTAGRLFGWTMRESIFAGAIVSISSTTILTKAFDELGIRGKVTEIVFGVLVFEDLVAILLLAILTAIAGGGALSGSELALTVEKLLSFLIGLLVVGMLIVPRLMRWVVGRGRSELTLITAVGICFAAALLALTFGYSVALGAFLAGSLVAESDHGHEVATLVAPVRDIFAAIFFVSVGMLIDPVLVARHWGAVLAFIVIVMAGKTAMVSTGAFVAGQPPRLALQAGMSLSQIGEFSFIIAALGLSSGATRDFLYPVAVAVSAITSLATPAMIRASGPLSSWLDRALPRPVQNFLALYGSWIERLRGANADKRPVNPLRGKIIVLMIDSALLALVIILAHVELERFTAIVVNAVHVQPGWARLLVLAGSAMLAAPLVIGLAKNSSSLAAELARRAIPDVRAGKLDLAASPRQALRVTLQIGVIALVLVPMFIVTQPFIPVWRSALVFVLLLVVFVMTFWRRASDLYGHTRAGAEVIVMALAQHAAGSADDKQQVERLHNILPGLGEPVPVRLTERSAAIGRTLRELDLRANTGAIVLAIRRSDGDATAPSGSEVLRAGDVLALAGSGEAIETATAALEMEKTPE